LRAGQLIANRGPRPTGCQQKLRRACQRYRPSHQDLSVFEAVDGRPDLIDSAYFNGAGQRIFVYASLFKFGAVVSQPAHNPIRILLYLCFVTIWHYEPLSLRVWWIFGASIYLMPFSFIGAFSLTTNIGAPAFRSTDFSRQCLESQPCRLKSVL
jgi:hypothetical protein